MIYLFKMVILHSKLLVYRRVYPMYPMFETELKYVYLIGLVEDLRLKPPAIGVSMAMEVAPNDGLQWKIPMKLNDDQGYDHFRKPPT